MSEQATSLDNFDFGDLKPIPITEQAGTFEGDEPTYTPGGRANCPKCGKELNVTQQGKLRSHTCVNDVPRTRGSKPKGKKGVPQIGPNSKKLMVAAIAGTTEWGVSRGVGRYVPCPPEAVPSRIAEPDIMVTPLVEALWPALPAGLRQTIDTLADNTDLVLCALAWADYFRELRKWARVEHKAVLAARGTQEPASQYPPPFEPVNDTQEGGDFDGNLSRRADGIDFGGAEPFRPVD